MFHDDLLDLARRTFELDQGPGRPKQANLRRTVSTAYYALFHLLVFEATDRMVLASPDSLKHQRALGRAFEHETMKLASAAIHATHISIIGSVSVPNDLKEVAKAFVELQLDRHAADYDLTNLNTQFTKDKVRLRLEQAEAAFTKWRYLREDPAARLYLSLLTTYQHMKSRK